MDIKFRKKQNIKVVSLAVITLAMLFVAIAMMIFHIYSAEEADSYENLHIETRQIKNDINLQLASDRENLITMANFAANLYKNGEDYSLLFESFEEIGLFEDVRVLLPDNSYTTKQGIINNPGDLSFNEEKQKGMYISGRVNDLVNEGKEVVRSAVPVVYNGKTVAMIYGIIDLQKLEDHYLDAVRAIGADLFLIEQENGNFIIDTKRNGFGTVVELSETEFCDGYTYEDMVAQMSTGGNGYTSFMSVVNGAKLYAHYAPLEHAEWEIMVAKPASEVFKAARKTGRYLLIMAVILIMIMILYVAFVLSMERGNLLVNAQASVIRKRLLEANQSPDKINEALRVMTEYSRAHATFFMDSYGERHTFVSPKYAKRVMTEEERRYFSESILAYVSAKQSKHGANVYFMRLVTDNSLMETDKALYEFMQKKYIRSIDIVSVTHNNRNNSLLCVVNSNRKQIMVLLKDIAVCFSMAIYNRKYLTDTESMALTDALTGVANRMAYKNDIKAFAEKTDTKLNCIYIDVNELNYYNNKYGHAAGDQMLLFIAETLSSEFSDSRIYRMGGDEFLIFTFDIERAEIEKRIERANKLIREMKYNISVGIKKRADGMPMEELVNEAEKRMYVEKAKFYQSKDKSHTEASNKKQTEVIKTGIKEVDAYLSVLKNKNYGVFCVSLETDKVSKILSPSDYFKIPDENTRFSDVLKQYIYDYAKPEFQRTLNSFIRYDAIEQQMMEGVVPTLSYVKKDGSMVKLSIWSVPDELDDGKDTVWIFEKEEN